MGDSTAPIAFNRPTPFALAAADGALYYFDAEAHLIRQAHEDAANDTPVDTSACGEVSDHFLALPDGGLAFACTDGVWHKSTGGTLPSCSANGSPFAIDHTGNVYCDTGVRVAGGEWVGYTGFAEDAVVGVDPLDPAAGVRIKPTGVRSRTQGVDLIFEGLQDGGRRWRTRLGADGVASEVTELTCPEENGERLRFENFEKPARELGQRGRMSADGRYFEICGRRNTSGGLNAPLLETRIVEFGTTEVRSLTAPEAAEVVFYLYHP